LTGSANLTGTGNTLDNLLVSNAGVDSLIGGSGNDTYVVNNPGDSVVENFNEGIDTVQIGRTFGGTPSFTLGANIENGTNLGAVNLTLMGNSFNNILIGGSGSDVLFGGAGNDTLDGGPGLDVGSYSGSRTSYTITQTQGSFAVSGPDGTDMVSNVEKLIFGDGSVKLLGSVAHASGADLFGDGVGDVVWRNDDGITVLWSMSGTAITGGGPLNGGAAISKLWNIAATADFTGDGKGDILWRSDGGAVAVWGMSGTDVTGGGAVNGGAAISTDWQIAGVGDFSGDHKADILWHNSAGQEVLWLMNGANVVGGGYVNDGASVTTDWYIAGVADLSGDGKSDILWRNTDGTVALWTMNSSTVTGGGVINGGVAIPNDWKIAGTADFNGDGKGDILWHSDGGGVALWLMNGTTVIGGGAINGGAPISTDWQVAGVGDFSGDHKADILWHNAAGQEVLWQMNGANIVGGGLVAGGAPVPQDWIIT
jgi:hypothetical protein